MKRYSTYKQTGYDWLPEVPEHWIKKSIRAITKPSDRRNGDRTDLELLSLYRDYGVIPKSSRDDNHNVESEDLSKYRHVKKHNLVINKMKAWQGSLGISDYEGIVSPAYIVCDVVDTVHSLYFHHLLRSKPFKTFYNRISYGVRVGQWDMNYEDFKTLHIYLPPLDEQKAIADFLDKKTKQIDRFISLQKEAISLLKELRQAEITKAVTKGLDENAEMKDSGVEWIGEIPKGWQISKVKHYYKVVNGSTPKSSNYMYWNGDIQWITPTDMANSDVIYSSERTITELGMNSCGTHLIPKNSLVLSTRAPIGHVCITGVELCTNQGCKALVNEKTTDVKFHYYYLSSQTDELNKRGNGATFLELSTTSLANFPLIMPELHEQKEIASYLDKKCAEIDSAIQNKEALIQKVTEYKTRLISDAVTGKIDVRGEAI